MTNLPADANIRAVLEKAAADPTFHMLLINERETALKGFSLKATERNLLLAASGTQIEKMVEQARDQKWYEKPLSRRAVAITAATGALALGGLFLVASATQSMGIRPESVGQMWLKSIAMAEANYRQQYGRYGSLEELTGGSQPFLPADFLKRETRFVFEVKLAGDSFSATVRHRISNRAWQVGADGQVKPME